MNAKQLQEIFDYFHLNLKSEIEQIELYSLDKNSYSNFISAKSVFMHKDNTNKFDDGSRTIEEVIGFGQALTEYCNITFTLNKKKPLQISELFKKYQSKYKIPSKDFILEFYSDFRKIGLSDLVVRSVLFSLLESLYITRESIPSFDYISYFNYLVTCINPLNLSINTNQRPINTIMYCETSFRFLSNNDGLTIPVMVYTGLYPEMIQLFEVYNTCKNNIKIFRCTYCHEFFVSQHGNNKACCVSCQNKSIEEKKSEDLFWLEWRKKYITMRKRFDKYNLTPKEKKIYHEKYTNKWAEDSKIKREEYRAANDLCGFKEYLKESLKNPLYKITKE